jgi:signal transduction histidine kinase/ActR/RegA family two-component response regulator
VPSRSDDGQIRGFVHSIIVITDLKKAEAEKLEARQAAEEHQRRRAEEAERHQIEQDQWIDNLCHELRNPLNGIYGNVELMEMSLIERRSILAKDHLDESDMRRLRELCVLDETSVDAVAKCVAHQKVITDDVLNVSKLEQGKITLQKIEFNPKTTLADVAKMFEAQASQKGLTMRVDFPVSDTVVVGDPSRLSQVVINLVANSLKFTNQGSITLSLDVIENTDTHVTNRVTVRDTGVGMDQTDMDTLFRRFAQVSSTTFHEHGGSGLGLYISKGLVELMGGTITVDSGKGQGSKFTFTFVGDQPGKKLPSPSSMSPIKSSLSALSKPDCLKVEPEKPVSMEKLPIIPTTSGAKLIRNILVVEDNDINQRIMSRILTAKGYNVAIAEHGALALNHMASNPVELIFMDMQMPVMDGLEATRQIRRRESETGVPPVPIIGLSGNARENHAADAYKVGMNEYLTKPILKDRIYAVIDQFELTCAGAPST